MSSKNVSDQIQGNEGERGFGSGSGVPSAAASRILNAHSCRMTLSYRLERDNRKYILNKIVLIQQTQVMSELQRAFARAKLSGLPYEPPMPVNGLPQEEDDSEEIEENDLLRPLPESNPDDDSSSASSASSASSTGTIRPSPSKHLFARPRGFVQSPFVPLFSFYLLVPLL